MFNENTIVQGFLWFVAARSWRRCSGRVKRCDLKGYVTLKMQWKHVETFRWSTYQTCIKHIQPCTRVMFLRWPNLGEVWELISSRHGKSSVLRGHTPRVGQGVNLSERCQVMSNLHIHMWNPFAIPLSDRFAHLQAAFWQHGQGIQMFCFDWLWHWSALDFLHWCIVARCFQKKKLQFQKLNARVLHPMPSQTWWSWKPRGSLGEGMSRSH